MDEALIATGIAIAGLLIGWFAGGDFKAFTIQNDCEKMQMTRRGDTVIDCKLRK